MTDLKAHQQSRLRTLERLDKLSEPRTELLADVVDQIEAELLDFEVPAIPAKLIANAVADRLAEHWGGQTLSFPRDYMWKLVQRELEIYDLFNGSNMPDIIRASGLSDRGAHKLIKRFRQRLARQSRKDQGDMFTRAV
jgi:Mor family transcriptional regulator